MAAKVLLDCGINTFPVDLTKILKAYNIKLCKYNDYDDEAINSKDGFTENVEGVYIIHYNYYINSKKRKRFTIAHELGHIMLGHIKVRNILCRGGDINEEEANFFARCLLAPECIINALDTSKDIDIKMLSDYFEVSKDCATYALNNSRRFKNYSSDNDYDKMLLSNFSQSLNAYCEKAQ